MNNQGALPSQHIKKLIEDGNIKNGNKENIQPASLDLTIDEEIYRLPHVFLPKVGQKIEDAIKEIGAEPYTFDLPLEVNTPYLVKLREELDLPKDVYGYANPKSSVGRIDLRVTMLADKISRFDSAGEKGFKGKLWAIIEPKSFRIKIGPGDTLLQLRLFYSDSRFSEGKLEELFQKHNALYLNDKPVPFNEVKVSDRDGGLILTVDVKNGFVGWRCEGSQSFMDFSKRNFYEPEQFFTKVIKPKNKGITLRKGDFYILYTRERLALPPDYAAEITAMDVRSGEYRSHYAGFIDPGFGHGREGNIKGAPIVLEVRPFEDNIVLIDNQPICKVIFEKTSETPDRVYGEEIGSHYTHQQGPRLSKHFKASD
ncbi:2'-deoxycytidine 5'-triphosphate deaminase [bacterium]|nr:2'-deoxycytidine 5'-triphosphate deaminase [bacterium]|tara:strand:- start:4765 stop:5871 length:1107 start_codon:yes stop_codon:yes gene_type:complete